MSVLLFDLANYMDNWKCTGILRGDGSPVNSSSISVAGLNAAVPPGAQTSGVGAAGAGRYDPASSLISIMSLKCVLVC